MPFPPAIDWDDLAAVANAAHLEGRNIIDTVAVTFDITREQATHRLSDARSRLGMDIPRDRENQPPPITPGAWVNDAACAGLDPDLFSPGRGEPCDQAKAVCAACPVCAECLDYAMANNEKAGIWGGLSERERRRLRSRRPRVAA